MRNRLRFHLDSLLQQVLHHKLRFVLGFLGFFLSGILMISGFLAMDSYYHAQFDQYSFYGDERVIQYRFTEHLDDETMFDLTSVLGDRKISFLKKMNGSFKWDFIVQDTRINLMFTIYGTSPMEAQLVMTESTIRPSTLLKGRGITQTDIGDRSNVILIDDVTEQLLFSGNGLGQTVTVPIMGPVLEQGIVYYRIIRQVAFEVIGVYSSNRESKLEFARNVRNNESFSHLSRYYIPLSVDLVDFELRESTYVFWGIDEIEAKEELALSIVAESGHRDRLAEYHSYRSILFELGQTLNSVRKGIILVMIALMLISSFIIVEGQVFSIKERVSELGIKRAVGATKADLVKEIVFETLVVAMTAIVCAIAASVLLVLAGLNIVAYQNQAMIIPLVIRPQTLLLASLIVIVTSLASSIVPSVVATRIEIVDALRFE